MMIDCCRGVVDWLDSDSMGKIRAIVKDIINRIIKILGLVEDSMSSDIQTGETTNGEKAPVVMYTTAWCPDCWRAKQVMNSMQVKYQEIDITNDEEATELVIRLNNGNQSVPTIVFADGSVMTEPPTHLLVQKLQSLQ